MSKSSPARLQSRVVFHVLPVPRAPEASRLRHHVEGEQVIAGQGQRMQIQRRTLREAGGAGLALAATRTVRAASGRPRAKFVISVGGPVDGPIANGWRTLTAEFQKGDFLTTSVSVIDPLSSFTANEMRAAQIVAAPKDVKEPVVILGVSNQGAFLPLVAAARPVRRFVYINATIPQPGKAFIEICNSESVAVPGSILDKLIKGAQPVTDEFLRLRADPQARWPSGKRYATTSTPRSTLDICPTSMRSARSRRCRRSRTWTFRAPRTTKSGQSGSSRRRVGSWAS